MNDERRAGEALSRAAFGLGGMKMVRDAVGDIAAKPKKGAPAKRPPLNVRDVLTPEQKVGMDGCSCSKRKVQ